MLAYCCLAGGNADRPVDRWRPGLVLAAAPSGVDIDRAAVRLALVLHYAEQPSASDWRAPCLLPVPDRTRCRRPRLSRARIADWGAVLLVAGVLRSCARHEIALCIEYDGSHFPRLADAARMVVLFRMRWKALSEIAGIAHWRQLCPDGPHRRPCDGADRPFRLPRSLETLVRLGRGANTLLPESVAVRWRIRSPMIFMPASRHADGAIAMSRHRPQRPALAYATASATTPHLDVAMMRRRRRPCSVSTISPPSIAAECRAKSPVKALREARVRAVGDYVLFDFRSDPHFCITWCATWSAAWYTLAMGTRPLGSTNCWPSGIASGQPPRSPDGLYLRCQLRSALEPAGTAGAGIRGVHRELKMRTRIKICGITHRGGWPGGALPAPTPWPRVHPKNPRYVRPDVQPKSLPPAPFVTVVPVCSSIRHRVVGETLAQVPVGLLQFHGDG